MRSYHTITLLLGIAAVPVRAGATPSTTYWALAWSSPDINVNARGLKKILVIADVQTGKNAFGGIGGNFYFNDYVALIVGPVFFVDSGMQPGEAKQMWTKQLDIDIPFGR